MAQEEETCAVFANGRVTNSLTGCRCPLEGLGLKVSFAWLRVVADEATKGVSVVYMPSAPDMLRGRDPRFFYSLTALISRPPHTPLQDQPLPALQLNTYASKALLHILYPKKSSAGNTS